MSDRIHAAETLAPSATLFAEPVKWVKHWNEHLFSFAIARPPSFRFRSGEFVMIGLPGEGRPLLRAYSIASPSYSDELEFLSIKVDDGPLTSRLKQIRPGDHLFLGRKPTGTLVADALLPGRRLFLLSTGTGLAPFLSIVRDPEIYDRFSQVTVVHSVRKVSDLAYRDELTSLLAGDPLVQDQALVQLDYLPTVTREKFLTSDRITTLIESGKLIERCSTAGGELSTETDRFMMCGSMAMIRDIAAMLEERGFVEGSNANPGSYVIERAFVG
ncbi:ferredoxin--NADP reductase [soil metagenome]